MTNTDTVIEKFHKLYGNGGEIKVFFAPGRVNLIGDHTDYNGGHVLPCALTFGTVCAARKREDHVFHLYSANFPDDGIIECPIAHFDYLEEHLWMNYFNGVAAGLCDAGCQITSGADILFYGDVPLSSGLSSSASFELATGIMLRDLYGDMEISLKRLAMICQDTENTFIGHKCGILDQFASAMGKKDCAIYLNASTLSFIYMPLKLPGIRIVLANTGIRQDLKIDDYNKRFEECREALHDLKKMLPIHQLCDILGDQFEEYRTIIHDPVCRKRARHVIYENQRTIQASSALISGNLKRFGTLLRDSHISLRDDYEVSCPELDFLAARAWENPDCIGARMTGAGFGGCTISLVRNEGIDDFIRTIGAAYEQQFNRKAEFYIADTGDGARALN